jgi:DUF4097 and DUF4098 domain-containing protein YvlB
MAGAPPPYPPPYPPQGDWKFQRRVLREQARAQRDATRSQWKMYREQQRAQVRGIRATRGGSMLGPLLLIGVGVVFLLLRIGQLSYAEVGRWYERWWPLVLLAGGVILLAEWAFDQTRPEDHPYYRRSRVGGGVIFLMLLLCVPGIVLSAAHGNVDWFSHGLSMNEDNIDEFLGDRHESDQTLDQAIPAGDSFTVSNPHGDITVSGTSEDGQIHISAHKQVYSRSDSEAESKARQLAPMLVTSGSSVMLNVPSVEGSRVDMTITVPNGTATTVGGDHGHIHVSSLKAPVTVTANHGDVEFDAIGGNIMTHINNKNSSLSARGITGDVTVEGNCKDVDVADVTGAVSLGGDFFGKTHAERIGGAFRFHTSRTDFQLGRLDGELDIRRGELSGDQIVGPVSLSARSYNVTLNRVAGDVSVTTSDGSVDVTSAPPMGNVTIQNRNGSVSVTVPEHAAFSVQAETRDGDVDTDLPSLAKSEENNTARLSGSVGGGGSLVRINTTDNDISLRRGVIAAMPVEPPAPPVPAVPAVPRQPSRPRHVPKVEASGTAGLPDHSAE